MAAQSAVQVPVAYIWAVLYLDSDAGLIAGSSFRVEKYLGHRQVELRTPHLHTGTTVADKRGGARWLEPSEHLPLFGT